MKKQSVTDNFEKTYWDENYSDPETMDGIGNAKEHVKYLSSLFNLEYVDISSVVDLGFGTGDLFKAMMKEFKPYKAYGIEPSELMFQKADINKLKPVESTSLKIENIDLLTWSQNKYPKKWASYDLGICTSVLQYIPTKDLKMIIPELSKRVKYLYLTVPTDKELERQVEDLDFYDRYALRRSKGLYQRLLREHFTFISSRVLESKHHFDEETTFFTDLLFRF